MRRSFLNTLTQFTPSFLNNFSPFTPRFLNNLGPFILRAQGSPSLRSGWASFRRRGRGEERGQGRVKCVARREGARSREVCGGRRGVRAGTCDDARPELPNGVNDVIVPEIYIARTCPRNPAHAPTEELLKTILRNWGKIRKYILIRNWGPF